MYECVRGMIPRGTLSLARFRLGTRQKREREAQTDRETDKGQLSRAGHSLPAVPRKKSSNGDPTRLWSRVIGGPGWCPACSMSRLPHHRFSPNFPRGAGCNADLLGSRASSKFGGRIAANGPWKRACGRWTARSEVEVISSPRSLREVGGAGDRGQGTRDTGQVWLENSASLCLLAHVDCVHVAMLWRRVDSSNGSSQSSASDHVPC